MNGNLPVFWHYYTTPQQHVLRGVDAGDKHSVTISVKDENGDLFDFNSFTLEFDLEMNWLYIQCLHQT